MDFLKKIFPHAFKVDSVANLVVTILIYLVIGLVAGFAIALLAKLPLVGALIGLLGGAVDLYVVAGIVLSALVFAKVLK